MVSRSKLLGALGVLVAAGALAAACGSNGASGSGNGGVCIPNATVPCACLGGVMGVQSCNADGKTYSMCQCGATTTGSGGSTTTSIMGTGGSACQCVNPSGELYCGAAACNDAGTGDGGSCVTY